MSSSKQWTGPDWVTAIATVMIFITTACYAYIANKQWKEMQSGGKDTHKLALAAKAQSEQAVAQTTKMAESLTKTDELIRQSAAQAKATSDLARQAKQSADTARAQLELSERPWLTVSFTVETPLTFLDGGTQLALRAHITNIGHSVATGVVVPIQTYLASDANAIFREPLERQQKMCGAIASTPFEIDQDQRGMVVFPGGIDDSQLVGLGISKAEMESTKTINPHFRVKHILPIIVGCVDYRYATSSRHHQTRFIYHVQRFDPATPPNIFSIEVGREVPSSSVILIRYAFGGFVAN